MKHEHPVDPVVTRRVEELVTVGFRTTLERREALRRAAKSEGHDNVSSLIRIAVEDYLSRRAK